MQVFHLGNAKYAHQLTGDGARLFGGRWNQVGSACIYTSATRSLCLLEYLANVPIENMPPDLAITEYFIPDGQCRFLSYDELPEDWDEVPSPMSTKLFGSALLARPDCLCFAVPSVVVPQEKNFILNPAAAQFHRISITAVNAFVFDSRIKTNS